MKTILVFAALFVTALSFSNVARAADPKVVCLEAAYQWYYKLLSSEEAKSHATEVCKNGGSVTCVSEAYSWFYKTESTSQSLEHATQLCSGKN